ncbi:kinase-like domain-containing protein [Rhizophagus irregularis DAOM 181602=DAOM 197198]|nr:kinase-like domain-containing protein [Rhizophagus irregularis DAOM 181602=DAOM 197198]
MESTNASVETEVKNGEIDDESTFMNDIETRKAIYGICTECDNPFTGDSWCQKCNAKRFKENFKNWTSGNKNIDEFIQEQQLNAVHWTRCCEWIPFEKFQNVTYISRGGFDNSNNISKDFLNEVKTYYQIYGRLRPEIPDYLPKLFAELIMKCWNAEPENRPTVEELCRLINELRLKLDYKDAEICNQIEESERIRFNEQVKNKFKQVQHPQAIYTSRFLNYRSLPNPMTSSYKISQDIIQFISTSQNSEIQFIEQELIK